MSLRAVLAIGLILFALSAANAQQPEKSATTPPVFQGLMVDAKGKTVGRVLDSNGFIVRQISGVWVAIQVLAVVGFEVKDPGSIAYYFQSADCSGPSYLLVGTLPAQGLVMTVPPATQPSIYFPGTPLSLVTFNSVLQSSGCSTIPSEPIYAGLTQSVPVSSLGLTPPFSVK
jgi:hypothetical protein